MLNPYLPANHQDAGDVPEEEEQDTCEACLDTPGNIDEINSIRECGLCSRCAKKYLK